MLLLTYSPSFRPQKMPLLHPSSMYSCLIIVSPHSHLTILISTSTLILCLVFLSEFRTFQSIQYCWPDYCSIRLNHSILFTSFCRHTKHFSLLHSSILCPCKCSCLPRRITIFFILPIL